MGKRNAGRLFGRAAPAVLAAALLATGCSFGGNGDRAGDGEPKTVKVMYYDEKAFYDQYGMLFAALHPEIEFEVVSTQSIRNEAGQDFDEAMKAFIEEQKPDVLMLTPNQYAELSGEGRLLELDARIEEESYDKDGLLPGMIDYLKEQSGGKLYGLVPSFYSQALYYNKDLFDRFGIPYPTDRMSWQEVLQLAMRFPTTGSEEDRVYGLRAGYANQLFHFASAIGQTQNLSYVDPTAMQVTVNSDAWKSAFQIAADALRSGALYVEDPSRMAGAMGTVTYEELALSEPFVGGKVAMALDGTYLYEQIRQAQAAVGDRAVKNWDLVTLPVDPQNPEYGTGISIGQIFAVHAQSGDAETAWQFVRYITSDEFARVTSKRYWGSLPVRVKYFRDDEGHNFEAFYSLKPAQSTMITQYEKLPQTFTMQFMTMAMEAIQRAYDEEKPLDAALDELQQQAQEMLLLALEEERNQAPGEGQAAEGSS